jgi:hypothetical protein
MANSYVSEKMPERMRLSKGTLPTFTIECVSCHEKETSAAKYEYEALEHFYTLGWRCPAKVDECYCPSCIEKYRERACFSSNLCS